jgi:hypothetical protein
MSRKNSAVDATAPPQPTEAALARQKSESRLREVQGFWPEIRALADSFRSLRTENHFADRLGKAHE